MRPPSSKAKPTRSDVLSRYRILDTPPESAFDELALLAANICSTPIAFISVADRGRHWLKSKIGFDLSQVSHEFFSAHRSEDSDLLIIPDALSDERFSSHPWVVSDPRVRFYAGVPLITPEGVDVGTLSVLDRVPRALDAVQIDALQIISRQVMAHMELRRADLDRTLTYSIFDAAGEGIYSLDSKGRVTRINPAAARMFGWSPEELVGKEIHRMVHHSYPDGRPYPAEQCPIYGALREGRVCHMTDDLFFRKDGVSFPVEYTNTPIFRDGKNLGAVVIVRDVSDRRREEEARSRLASILESTDEAIIALSLDRIIRTWNPAATRLMGYTAAEVIGKPISLLRPSGFEEEAEGMFQRLLDGERISFETKRLKKGGEEIDILLTLSQIKDATGRVVGISGIGRDIGDKKRAEAEIKRLHEELEQRVVERTAQLEKANQLLKREMEQKKEAESALRESEERYRYALRATNDVIWDWDLVTDEMIWSENLEKVLGYPSQALGGPADSYRWWYERIHPDDRERVSAIVTALAAGDKETGSSEYRFRRSDGTYAVILDRGYILRDERKKPIRMIGSMLDVTEQRRAEEKVRFQAGLLDIVEQAVIATDRNGTIFYWNRFAETLYGWSSAEVVGRNILEVTPASMSREQGEEVMNRLKGGQSWSGEFWSRRKEGVPFPAWVTVTPIFNEKREQIGMIGLSLDVTEQKISEETLQRKTVEAEEANRLKSHFVSLVSHELRTPMNAILGFTQLLKNPNFGGNTAKRATMLERIDDNARVLLDLINSILDLSKIEAGQMTVQWEEVSLAGVVTEVMNNLRLLAEKKGLSLRLIQDEREPLLRSDRTKLAQIFTNLLANAIKFTEKGSITVRIGRRADEKEVWTEVSDTGIGISEEEIGRLFEPFYQADPLGGRSYEGSGLGLSIVKKLVTLFGGEVEVASRPGEGSVFTIRLPAGPPPPT